MSVRFASRMSRLGTETAFEVLVRARALEAQGKDVVHLEVGEPDFDTPENVIQAGVDALQSGWTHYGPANGDAELREALAQIANVEVHLDSALADAGLFPAIDVRASRTRGEDALVDADERAQLDALRGPARALDGDAAWRYLAEQLESG